MENSFSVIGMLLQTLLALIAVCGLAYVIFRVILPRLQLVQNSGGIIRVVERVGLDAKRSLYVVEVAGKWMLVGSSENGVNLVSELDQIEAENAEAEIQVQRDAQFQKIQDLRSNFARKLASVMNRKESKTDAIKPPDEKRFP